MATVLIYRPLGEHPPRTKMGELELGVVHSIAEEKAGPYLGKGFAIMPPDAKTAKADKLASDYAAATKAAPDVPQTEAAPNVFGEPLEQEAPPITETRRNRVKE